MHTFKFEELVYIVLVVIVLFIVLTVFVVATTIIYHRKKMNYFNEKKMLEASYTQELLITQIEIQDQTFKTISQEIHDNIGQVLSLAKLNLNTFENLESPANKTRIEATIQLVSKAIVDLRNLSRSMHGDQLHELGLAQTIEKELAILRNTGRFNTAFTLTGEPYKIDGQKEIIIYRMLQEAINNSVKHAMAKSIDIRMNYNAKNYSLCITDDGNGFDVENISSSKNGMGLTSMKNRAAMIGGSINIESVINKGTAISFTLPHPNNNH